MKLDLKRYLPGFLIILLLASIAMVLSKQTFLAKWGIECAIYAPIFGFILSNIIKFHQISKAAEPREIFLK